MANPPPPAATYPAMGTRVGFSDGNPLTTALLNALAGDLVAQDGNGNVQQIVSVRVGPDSFLATDPSNNGWLTFNAYFDPGSAAWYPVNSAVASYGLCVSATGITIQNAPVVGGAGALTWSVNSTFSSSANLNTILATLASQATSISTNATAITTEATARAAADASLSTAITTEAATRASADTALGMSISTEASARAAGDAALAANLATEATTRAAADTALWTSIAAEATARAAADATLLGDIAVEVSERAAEDNALQTQINTLTFLSYNYARGGPVACATTGPLPTNYYDPANQVLIGLSTTALGAIDGVSPTVGMRILVDDETDAANNGIYAMTQQSNGTSTPWVLQRATDANTAIQLAGIMVYVSGGTTNNFLTFLLPLAASQITLGTTALNFVEFQPAQSAVLGIKQISASTYTVQLGDQVLEVDATAGAVIIEFPPSLGASNRSQVVEILKVDLTDNSVGISPDGSTIIDEIIQPATAAGQINGSTPGVVERNNPQIASSLI
jgi:hypothetical protein